MGNDFTAEVVCDYSRTVDEGPCFEGFVDGTEYAEGYRRVWVWTCPSCGEEFQTDPDD